MPKHEAIKPLALLCAFFILPTTGCDDSSNKTAQAPAAPEVKVITLATQSQAITSNHKQSPANYRAALWRIGLLMCVLRFPELC